MTTYKEDIAQVWTDYATKDLDAETNRGEVRAVEINPDPRAHRITIAHRDLGRDPIDEVIKADTVKATDSLETKVLYHAERDQNGRRGPRSRERGYMDAIMMTVPDRYILKANNLEIQLERYDRATQITGVDDIEVLDDAEEQHEEIVHRLRADSAVYDIDGVGEEWKHALELLDDQERFQEAHHAYVRDEESDLYIPDTSFLPDDVPESTKNCIAHSATMLEQMLRTGERDPVRSGYIEDRIKAIGGIA